MDELFAPRFQPASEADAAVITGLRRRVWETCYRGIYPDDAIDNYDFAYHLARDLARIRDGSYRVYLILNGQTPVGYLYYQHTTGVHIQSLYLLPDCRGRGLGRRAMALVRDECAALGLRAFTCNCNAHNRRARGFYEHLGGEAIREDCGHASKREDQITYRFRV